MTKNSCHFSNDERYVDGVVYDHGNLLSSKETDFLLLPRERSFSLPRALLATADCMSLLPIKTFNPGLAQGGNKSVTFLFFPGVRFSDYEIFLSFFLCSLSNTEQRYRLNFSRFCISSRFGGRRSSYTRWAIKIPKIFHFSDTGELQGNFVLIYRCNGIFFIVSRGAEFNFGLSFFFR